MRQFFYFICTIALVGCSAVPSKGLIKTDLRGNPLTSDDFTVIVGDKVLNTFYTKAKLNQAFLGVHGEQKNKWEWTNLSSSGPMSWNIIDYQTDQLRMVYFDQDEINNYAGIKKGALTIRGITLGSSVLEVLEDYGKSYFGNESKTSIQKGESGLIYRFYNYPESSKSKYPEFDYIHFETNKGVVVGIHFWRKQSDAE